MNYKRMITDAIVIFVVLAMLIFIPINHHQRNEIKQFYQAINEWELSPADTIWFDSRWDLEPVFTGNIVINIDGWEGNVYIVNDNDDTIFKYIKENSDETGLK